MSNMTIEVEICSKDKLNNITTINTMKITERRLISTLLSFSSLRDSRSSFLLENFLLLERGMLPTGSPFGKTKYLLSRMNIIVPTSTTKAPSKNPF